SCSGPPPSVSPVAAFSERLAASAPATARRDRAVRRADQRRCGSARAEVRAKSGPGAAPDARPISRKRDRFQWSRFDAERSRETNDEPTYARNTVEAVVKGPARPARSSWFRSRDGRERAPARASCRAPPIVGASPTYAGGVPADA